MSTKIETRFLFGTIAAAVTMAGLASLGGCPPQPVANDPNSGLNQPPTSPAPSGPVSKDVIWSKPFDFAGAGALSSVWGTGPSDVFVVGGTPQHGEIYHYDGSTWAAMSVPNVPILVWVFGFAADNVYAVGVGGGVVHYDGLDWRKLDAGTNQDLWGVWGGTPNDLWIVGGTVGEGDPLILHYDGSTFTKIPAPANDRSASSIFKVWGIGSRVFAVGERGLILSYDGASWSQSPAGAAADEDFVALWGTSENHIVAVGGRTGGRIANFDGTSWTTQKLTGVPGLNAIFMGAPDQAIIGGVNGYLGAYDATSDTLEPESAGTSESIHAMWSDGRGRYYAVGGRFSPPFSGVAFVRTLGDPGITPVAPTPAPDEPNEPTNPAPLVDCNNNGIEDADDILAATSVDCDANGVPDECDADADNDGVPDACDACPGADDGSDVDGDGVADACDVCPDDANDDSDGDGVCDSADICPGSDDAIDSDGDGVPNGYDTCTGDDASNDSDADGVCDSADICPGGDDAIDSDNDTVPDFCDVCPNDALDDSDGDGVCDSADVCPGGDDNVDLDNDGIPDFCDPDPPILCTVESDCPLGQNCGADGVCEPATDPDLEFGRGGNSSGDPYEKIGSGGNWDMTRGFQGFFEAFVSIRATGFAPGATVTYTLRVTQLRINHVLGDYQSSFPLTDAGAGVNEDLDFFIILFPALPPDNDIDGEELEVYIRIEDPGDSTHFAELTQNVIANVTN